MLDRLVKIAVFLSFGPLLTGCLTQTPVEVIDKGSNYYSKSGAIQIALVKEGESIKSIARKYKTTEAEILDANGLQSNAQLIAGMSLIIPKEVKNDVFISSNESYIQNDFNNKSHNEQIVASALKPLNQNGMKQEDESKKVTGYLVSKSSTIKNSDNQKIATKKDVTTEQPKLAKTYENTESSRNKTEDEDLDLTKEPASGTTSEMAKKVAIGSNSFKVSSPLDSGQFDWPVEGKVLSRYGKIGNRFNDGINIAAPLGTPVVAAAEGKVIYIGENIEGYGNLVIIKHENDYMTAYAHLKDVVVERGAKVKRGESIGTIGQSGNISQSQLHFSIRKGRKTINPEEPVS